MRVGNQIFGSAISQSNSLTAPAIPSYRRMLLWLAIGFLCLGPVPPCLAGGGPENVFLVVNSRSWTSRAIANHYCDLRSIPSSNVFFLDWAGRLTKTDIATFRAQILQPIIDEINKRKLADQIDYIVYSADFPYEIDFSREQAGKFRSGSLTGLTFLYQSVLSGQSQGLPQRNNEYASTSVAGDSSRGFSNSVGWATSRPAAEGRRYLLSTMLGYTSGRGNSLEQVIDYLRRGVAADGTFPEGTFYFMKTSDVRSKTRSDHFEATVAALRQAGARAEILNDKFPRQKDDVLGACLGKAVYSWPATKSRLLPGAIVDNLTSYGGILSESAGQTPISEPLKYGAVASSGTVIEPYASIDKFPHPTMYLHYFRGCSLAESFYLSVRAPYQLLILGDPLCQPFARIPIVETDELRPGQEVSGEVTLRPRVKTDADAGVSRFDFFVDGIKRHSSAPGEAFRFDSRTMPDGHHEIRIVASRNDFVQSQGRLMLPISVANRQTSIRVSPPAEDAIRWDLPFDLEVAAPKMNQIVIFHQHQLVGQLSGGAGNIRLAPVTLGLGPVSLLVAGIADAKLDNIFAPPVRLEVQPGTPLPARPSMVGSEAAPGIDLALADGSHKSIPSTAPLNWLEQAGAKRNEPITLFSSFEVPQTGLYQFQIYMLGGLELTVDGMMILRLTPRKRAERIDVPLHLEKGTHRLRLAASIVGRPSMRIAFGNVGTQAIAGPTFTH